MRQGPSKKPVALSQNGTLPSQKLLFCGLQKEENPFLSEE
jgi:hypothetical protein